MNEVRLRIATISPGTFRWEVYEIVDDTLDNDILLETGTEITMYEAYLSALSWIKSLKEGIKE